MKKKPKPMTVWATQRGRGIPCIWGPRREAIANCDPDERIVKLRLVFLKIEPTWIENQRFS